MSAQFNLIKIELHCNNTVHLHTDIGSHLMKSLELIIVLGKSTVHTKVNMSHQLPAMPKSFRIQWTPVDSPILLTLDQSPQGIASQSLWQLSLLAADQTSNDRMIQLIKSFASQLG